MFEGFQPCTENQLQKVQTLNIYLLKNRLNMFSNITELLVKVKPIAPLRSMSSGLEMKPMNAFLWFVGMATPFVFCVSF